MPSAVRVLLASAAVTVLAVTAGVVARGPQEPAPPATAPPVDSGTAPAASSGLAKLETRGLAVLRAPFCAGVADEAVEAALGAEPAVTEAWENGETAALTPRLTDVAHEHGCAWSAGRTTARGWVFAPPVTSGRARQLARSAAGSTGCEPLADAAAFGSPDVALVCERGGLREASYRGLFGEAWLVCTLTAPAAADPTELLDRTSRWCASVVTAATGATAGS